ncbi:hypothetical protein ASFV_Kyiv_2016_131_00115 [African swine fever virus]|uniref:Sulfhydryl oxidase n=1 Tax=African swine fever virus TaxID=10497 RepID=A0A5B8XA65_ASF|nr:hypothetical protein ASFV_Kyiv_2016_131_00115 [African swine fever virus]
MDTELYRVSAMHQVPAPRLFVSYKNPLTLNNSEDFQYWTFAFHNNVNNRLNKKIISWSEYKNIYEQSILKTIEYGKTDFIGAWSSL